MDEFVYIMVASMAMCYFVILGFFEAIFKVNKIVIGETRIKSKILLRLLVIYYILRPALGMILIATIECSVANSYPCNLLSSFGFYFYLIFATLLLYKVFKFLFDVFSIYN